MKWAQLKEVLDSDGIETGNERKKLFKEYMTRKELRDDLKNDKKFVKWATYPGEENDFKPFGQLGRKAQRKYELFCGGFLYYHDFEFKKYDEGKGYTDEKEYPEWKTYPDKFIGTDGKEYHGKEFEHKIYFRWLRDDEDDDIKDDDDPGQGEKNKKKNKVIIYITPTPPEFNANPPRPPAPPPPESND